MIINVDEDTILRQLELSDADDIFKIIDSQREYLGKWLPFVERTKALSDSEAFVRSVVDAPENKAELVFTIQFQGTFIGLIGFRSTDLGNKRTEIGYWLSMHYQGKGIVTKSLKRLCDFAFNEKDINRIEVRCASGNIPSKNIPLRMGFKLEGTERDGELLAGGIFTDLEVYSKLAAD